MQGSVAGQAETNLDARHRGLFAVAHRHLHLEFVRVFVDQQDAERAVVDDAAREVGDARQQLVEIQNGRELAPDFRQCLERAGVLALVFEEARVLDGHRDVRPELAHDELVDLGELTGAVTEQVECTKHAPLAAQRHHQFGLRPGDCFDVPRIARHVIDDDRLAFEDRGAHKPVSKLQSKVVRGFRVPHGIRQHQFARFFIEQVRGKRLEVGQPRDEHRDLVQQLVKVQHGRNFAAQLEEREHDLAEVRRRQWWGR